MSTRRAASRLTSSLSSGRTYGGGREKRLSLPAYMVAYVFFLFVPFLLFLYFPFSPVFYFLEGSRSIFVPHVQRSCVPLRHAPLSYSGVLPKPRSPAPLELVP